MQVAWLGSFRKPRRRHRTRLVLVQLPGVAATSQQVQLPRIANDIISFTLSVKRLGYFASLLHFYMAIYQLQHPLHSSIPIFVIYVGC